MLVFIVPLRNRATVVDWSRCWAICRETLASAVGQLGEGLPVRVVLVCKEHGGDFTHPRLDIVAWDSPDPADDWLARCKDKYRKLHYGLAHIHARYAPCYVMRLDADDLVSNRLAAYVLDDDNGLGYLLDEGYEWPSAEPWLRPWRRGFHRLCGSRTFFMPESGICLRT